MNIYEKLQEARVQLQGEELHQSGFNKFSNYNYFELGDFVPQATKILKGLKVTPLFNLDVDRATLTMVNSEKPDEQIVFNSPSNIIEMKGCNSIQNIGATQTYMRRYMYVIAFELSEPDIADGTDPNENDEQAEMQRIAKRKINSIELEAFNQAVQETETHVDMLFKLMNYGGTPEDMTFSVWREAMNKIEDKKSKMPVKKVKDLGL